MMETIGTIQVVTALGRVSAQAGVLVLVVLLVQWLFRKQLTPRWRCALWLLVVFRLLLPVSPGSVLSVFNWLPPWQPATSSGTGATRFVSSSQSLRFPNMAQPEMVPNTIKPGAETDALAASRTSAPQTVAAQPPVQPAATPSVSLSWPGILFGIWLAGVLGMALHLLTISIRLARKITRMRTVSEPGVLQLMEDCRARLGVRTDLRMVEGAEVDSPALHGLFKPRLLLPKGFTTDFSPDELRFVFLHELAHLKRHDLWLNWLFAALRALHWFNPLVWLAFVRWRADREPACDAMVLESVGAGQSRDYGCTILRLLERFTHRTASPGTVGILEDKRLLRRRIEMIARFKPTSRWSQLALLLMAVIAVGCLTNAKEKGATAVSEAAASDNTLPYILDLRPFYDKTYVTSNRTNSDFKGYLGRRIVDGLPFDVDGEIIVYGQSQANRGSSLRDDVMGIEIDRKFDELHLLHVVHWREYNGCPVAVVRLNYADGTHHDFDIRYNVQVVDWARLLSEEREVLTDPDTKIVWRGPGPYLGTSRLFKSVLYNPSPDKPVTSLDLISTRSRANYTLVAATVAKTDPDREVTAGLPLNEPAFQFDGTVEVNVVDRETGAPLVGADVYPGMSVDEQGVVADPILTSTNGVAQVKYPIGRTSYLNVRITKKGYLGQGDSWQSGDIPESITYRLRPATASIEGVVQDEAGQPVAGAEVRVNNYNVGGSCDQVYLPRASVKTDAAGRWKIEGLPEDYQEFGVIVTHPDFPQAQFLADGPQARGIQGNHIRSADFFDGRAVLKLAAGQLLSGSVRDARGQPVADASIFVGFDRYMSGAIRSKTDAGGQFDLKNLGLGDSYLTISSDGFAPEFLTVAVTGTNAPLDVVLDPGKVIHGLVVDTDGHPIEDANVSYDGLVNRQGSFGGRTLEWKTTTDAGGRFTWDSAPAEPVRLSIGKKGYMALQWKPVQTDTTNTITFTLENPLTIQGTVTDEETGEPVDRFTLTPGWPEGCGVRLEKYRASTGTGGHYEIHFDSPIIISTTPYDYVLQISARGYAPVQSRAIKADEGVVVWDVKLKKTPALITTVQTADGRPVAGVQVFLTGARDYLQLNDTQISVQGSSSDSYETDADGRFDLPPQAGDFSLVAAAPAGFALVTSEELTNTHTLTVQPWGCVEGTLLHHGRPMAGRQVYFFIGDGSAQRNIWMQTPATVDEQGRFSFTHVPPGPIRIQLKQPINDRSWSYKELQTVEVTPGETNTVEVLLSGRNVIGHWKRSPELPAEVNLEQGNIQLRPDLKPPPVPKDLGSQEAVQEWYTEWAKTDAGKQYMEAQRKIATLQRKSDGILRGEAIAPGKYMLSANFWGNAGAVAEVESRKVTIPEDAGADPDTPIDIGEVVVRPVKQLNVGETAPEFSVKTLDGRPLNLSEFRGKYVLLDFWATWCGPCVAETPHLKAAYDAFGSDPRLVMISLSLDQQRALPEKFAQEHDLQWLQGFLGNWSEDNVTKDYSVRGIPSIFLIGPDGKVVARNLRGDAIKSAIASALKTN